MSDPFIDATKEGLRFPLALDGELLYQGQNNEIFPSQFTAEPQPIQDHVDTIDGGAQTFQTSFGEGHSDFSERYLFTIPFNQCSGTIKRQLERFRKMGRLHDFAYWQTHFEFFTSPGYWSGIYLPHYRRNAGTWFAGLAWAGLVVGTDTFPLRVSLAGAEQVVNYEDGPVLSTPDPGQVTVSKFPDETGHVPIKFPGVIPQGELVEVEYFPVHLVSIARVTLTYAKALVESPSYQLQER